MEKYAKFIKNMLLGTGAGIIAGVGGAECADAFTDSMEAISIASTAAGYSVAIGSFLILHARDNTDLYREDTGRFRWRDYLRDMAKLNAGLVALDILYLAGRPVANYYIQKQGYEPSSASLLSDSLCLPLYYLLALPVGKLSGAIREKNYEEIPDGRSK